MNACACNSQAYTTYGVIGVKTWVYKGEILDGGRRANLRSEPEPRRPQRDRRDRDRDRDRDRRGPAAEPQGAVQPPPGEMGSARTATPILPPVASPAQQPSWKQEVRPPEAAPSEGGPKE
jgi:small subunit ribosomal protein S3